MGLNHRIFFNNTGYHLVLLSHIAVQKGAFQAQQNSDQVYDTMHSVSKIAL